MIISINIPTCIKLNHYYNFTLVLFHLIFQHSSSQPLQIDDDDTRRMADSGEKAWTMVGRKGHQLILNNKPFYFNGFNTYWLMVFAADHSTRSKVTDVFHEASTVGLTVCRTWAFNDGQWRALQISPSVYDEDVFQGLDFVVSEVRKYKIRLILPLVNNWSDYGDD